MINLTIVDSVLILFLLAGAVLGFKKGAIRSLVALVGLIALVVISYYLKNPVAEIFFKYAPFVNFKGSWDGLQTMNILLYEGIAYILVFTVLSSILSLIVKISGIMERVLAATIILGIPSKIIGAVLGFLEAIVLSFIILFVLLQFNTTSEMVSESSLANSIVDKTPIIGTMVNNTYQAIQDINALKDKYAKNMNKDAYNGEILSIMLEYEVITTDSTQKLINDKKLTFAGAQNILDSFKENNQND